MDLIEYEWDQIQKKRSEDDLLRALLTLITLILCVSAIAITVITIMEKRQNEKLYGPDVRYINRR